MSMDASDPHHADRRRQVETVLADIGVAEVPRIQVYNKIDRLADPARSRKSMDWLAAGRSLWVSAATGSWCGMRLGR